MMVIHDHGLNNFFFKGYQNGDISSRSRYCLPNNISISLNIINQDFLVIEKIHLLSQTLTFHLNI